MKKKYWIISIIILIFIFVFIIYLSFSGIQTISTDKNTYSLGEEVNIHWSDFSLQWESCDFRVLRMYRQEPKGWKRINYELYGFGQRVCVNGEVVGLPYPCDVSTFQFPNKIFKVGNLSWDSKIYEYKGKTSSCLDTHSNEILLFINYTINSYDFKEVPTGKYKLSFGSAEKIIEIK